MKVFRSPLASLLVMALGGAAHAATPPSSLPTVVLVHGAFADGSGWRPVAEILQKDGYAVDIVQEPETSLADDVAATNRVLDRLSGKAVLVGHSYGGAVITEAGTNAHVASLVYVAAFAPDAGEALGPLTGSMPPAAHSIISAGGGFLMVDPEHFPADFAADLPPAQARFMALSQVPINASAFGTPIGTPAWKTKPSYGIVALQDHMINPALERSMYQRAGASITEIPASHSVYVSQPRAVATVIERAASTAR